MIALLLFKMNIKNNKHTKLQSVFLIIIILIVMFTGVSCSPIKLGELQGATYDSKEKAAIAYILSVRDMGTSSSELLCNDNELKGILFASRPNETRPKNEKEAINYTEQSRLFTNLALQKWAIRLRAAKDLKVDYLNWSKEERTGGVVLHTVEGGKLTNGNEQLDFQKFGVVIEYKKKFKMCVLSLE